MKNKLFPLLLIILAALLANGCGSEKELDYKIQSVYKDTFLRTAQYIVVIPQRVSKDDLKEIQEKIKEQIGDTLYMFDYIRTSYYIDKVSQMGGWAFGELMPDENVLIHGFSKELYDQQVDNINNDKRDIIGAWLTKTAGTMVLTIFVRDNKYYLEQKIIDDFFTDGMLSVKEEGEIFLNKQDSVWVIEIKNKIKTSENKGGTIADLCVSETGNMSLCGQPDSTSEDMFSFERLKFIPGKIK